MLCPDVPLKVINSVNYALDYPSHIVGPSHRKFFHDPLSAGIIGGAVAMKMGYPAHMGVRAAQAHLLEDKTSDKMVKVKLKVGRKTVSLKNVFDVLTA